MKHSIKREQSQVCLNSAERENVRATLKTKPIIRNFVTRTAMTLLVLMLTAATAWADGAKTLPYSYGFENNDLEAEGWTVVDCTTNLSTITDNYHHSGNYCFQFDHHWDWTDEEQKEKYLISPEIDSNGNDFTVSFYYSIQYCNTTSFQVGYSTTTNEPSAFTWDDAISRDCGWTLCEKGFSAGTKYIAIKVNDLKEGDVGVMVDDFIFNVSGYLPPTNLTISEMPAGTITMNWNAPTSNMTITGYTYQYKKTSETEWSAEATVAQSVTTATLDNLEASTTYDFRVKTNYEGGQSSYYATITILTSLPFVEDFENGLGCWRVVDGDIQRTGIETPLQQSSVFAFWGDGPQYLISPQLNCTVDITVSFNYSISYTLYPKSFQVGYSTTTDDTSAFTWDTEVTSTTYDYVKYENSFPAGTKYIAVKYTSNSVYSLYLDNIMINVDGVLPPTQVSVSESTISCETATLTWTAPETTNTITGYAYQYKKASDAAWSAETITTGTSATISNLTADTDYEFRVKTLYGRYASTYADINFTTPTSLPYEQGFENGMGRWGMVDPYWGHTGINEAAARNGDNGFYFSWYNRAPQYLISPRFEGTNTMSVSFYYRDRRPDSGYYETFYVGYSTTTNDIDAFTWDSGTSASNVPWTLYENHSFPADTKYIAVKYTSTMTTGLYIDDFSIAEYSTYAKPTTIVVPNLTLTDTEATVSWNTLDGATGYAYQYKKASDAAWSAEATLNTNTVTLSGLTPNTNYSFRVKALYGSNASNYATTNFQTDGSEVDLPYTDGFENGMGGWRMIDCDLSTEIRNNAIAHSGGQYFGFHSVNHHQYLQSPHFAGGAPMKVSFYYNNAENYPAVFAVGYSSSKEGQITWGNQVTASSGEWTLYETTVPATAQYVLICCRAEGYFLYLDDFSFTGPIVLADDADNTTAISDAASLGEPSNIRLGGRTLYRDGDWNTLTLPFAVSDFTGTPLEGATVMTLGSTDFSAGTLTMDFTEVTSIAAGKPYIVKWLDGVNVTIGSTAEWDAFAESVNGGKSFAGKTVMLTSDISGVATMAGTAEHPFRGTFEGAGHTMNMSISDGGDGAAPFHYISGATIRNVKTTGTVSGGNHSAGLVGIAQGGTNSIRDCYVDATVSTSGSYVGGILGNGSTSTTTISNCLFGGSIAASNMGILYGWGEDGGTHKAENCVAYGNYAIGSIDLLLGNGNRTVTNCWKNTDFGSQGDNSTYIYTGGNHPLVSGYLGSQWTYDNGFVLRPTVNVLDENIVNPVFLGVTVDATPSPVETTWADFVGTYEPMSFSDADKSILFLGTANTLYYPVSGAYIGTLRAFFRLKGLTAGDLPDPNDPNLARRFVLNFGEGNGDTTTGIIEVEEDYKTPAHGSGIANSLERDAWYSVDGRQLVGKPTAKGIYINNGKKVVIK